MKSERQLKLLFIFIFVFTILNTLSVFAGPSRTTYQAKIVKPDGYPLEASSVNFKFTILDPAGTCILYSETYSSVNMSSTGGLISFALGSGVKTYPTSSTTTFEQVFSNITPSLSCDTGGPANYSPTATDIRKIVMQFHDGSGWQTLPAMSINAVPYAMYANEAAKLNGLTSSDFVQLSTVPTCTASEALRYTGAGFTCITVGNSVTSGTVVTALGYTPADSVSLTTVTSDLSTVSSTVAGVSVYASSVSSTVFSVSSTVTSLQSSVAASFAAITSSQWTTSGTNIFYNTGNIGIGTTTPVTTLDVSGGVRIGAESTTCAPALAGTLRYNASNVEYCNGTSWQAFGVSGSGITNFNGSTSGTQSFTTGTGGTAPAFNTSNGVHTLNLPLASTGAVTAGLLSNADYTAFTNKITSSAVSIAQVLGYVPADNAASGTYVQKANNLSDLTNIATARTNLGLGTFATANTLDLGSASATGTLAIARLPSFTGDATIAAASNTIILSNSGVTAGTYTKVTVDAKGRVTSSAALASSDVTTALGYTPANSTSGVTSLNGSTSQTQTFATGTTGTAPAFSTAAGVHTLNIPLASAGSVTGGLLSNADYTTFMNKITSSAASIAQVLGYTPASATALNNYLVKANNLSDLVSSATARTNLGVGYIGTLSSVDLGSADVSGTLAIARTPAYAGDVTKAAASNTLILSNSGVTAGTYTKVTVDAKGRVTSSSALTASDINVALGNASATAVLHLRSGTSQTASLKLTSGTLLTSPQSGTIEYDGANYYITDGNNVRRTIATVTSDGTIDGAATINNSSGNIVMTPNGSVVVSATTASTNSQTGALIVNGGVGVAGNLNVAGTISGSATIKGTGFRANQGAPDAADSSTVGYAFGQDGDTGLFSPGSGAANGVLAFYGNNAERMRMTSTGFGIGTSAPTMSLDIQGGSSVNGSNGLRVISTNSSGNNNALIEAIAKRSDGNVYGTFAGTLALAKNRTDTATSTNGSALGRIMFGGNHTDGSLSNLLYTTSIQGVAEGTFSDAITMPSGLAFYTGSTGYTTSQATSHIGTERLRISSSGNVGIGTTSPSAKLSVSGTALFGANGNVHVGGVEKIHIAGANSNPTMIATTNTGIRTMFMSAGALNTIGTDGGDISFRTSASWTASDPSVDGSDRMRITAAGSVGIGTTSPNGLLDVRGGVTVGTLGKWGVRDNAAGSQFAVEYHNGGAFSDANIKMVVNSSGSMGISTSAPVAKLTVNGSQSGMNDSGIFLINDESYPNDVTTGRPGLSFGYDNANDWAWVYSRRAGKAARPYYINGTMMVNPFNGNVGIGTTNPAAKLQLNGSDSRGITLSPGTTSQRINFLHNDNGNVNAIYANIAGVLEDGSAGRNYGHLVLATAPNTAGNPATVERVRITGNGDVGVGTANPGSRLDVRGEITTRNDDPNIGGSLALANASKAAGTSQRWRIFNMSGTYGNSLQFWTYDDITGSGCSGGLCESRVTFMDNGNVGIGTAAPDDRFVVSNGSTTGRYTTGGWTHTSDARLKHDIKPLENSLEKVVQLRGVAYTYNNDPKNQRQIGFLAQEVEPLFPQVVQTDKKGFKSMIYANLVAPVVEAIKELFQRLLGVEATIKQQSREIEMLKTKSSQLEEQNKALKDYLCEKDPNAKICK